ncbi:MAG: sigma-70 family RNA polymerase sigma factor [Acidimicrobiia bacterium]|nr:sigma-70 family RNA polymerase sigma factor [Acidimicrobiia bacterium]
MRWATREHGEEADRGDTDRAFDDLFRATWPRAVVAARRIVGPGGDPEGLAAEALTRAYDRWPSVRRHPAPDAWVLRVTINLALDRARRQPAGAGPAAIDLRDEATHGANVESLDDLSSVRLALGDALRALPEKQRHAVALRYLAGCSERDIAASLGINPGTVKTHLKRGLDRLRSDLGADAEADLALTP